MCFGFREWTMQVSRHKQKVDAKLREQGISRYDLGREGFYRRAGNGKKNMQASSASNGRRWDLVLTTHVNVSHWMKGYLKQLKKYSLHCMKKVCFTRGEYIINWDPAAKTALSDIEAIHKDVQGRFYHMRYPLADGTGHIEMRDNSSGNIPGGAAVALYARMMKRYCT